MLYAILTNADVPEFYCMSPMLKMGHKRVKQKCYGVVEYAIKT